MSDDRIGWDVNGRFYPHNGADALRHGDFALIREVTGLSLDEFDRGDDPLATETGWLAVAVWQANSDMRRDQVRNFIEQLPAGAAKRVGWSVELEADPTPLEPSGAPTPSAGSGGSSRTSSEPPAESLSPPSTNTEPSPADASPEPSTLDSSGGQPSPTGQEDSGPKTSEASIRLAG